jgi:oligoendopeptidase F
MLVSDLYKNRLKSLKKDYNNYITQLENINIKINEYIELNNQMLSEIEEITNDENIDINIKYIKINEKTVFFEKISTQLDKAKNEIINRRDSLIKDLKTIIEKIANDNKCVIKESENYVLSEIGMSIDI